MTSNDANRPVKVDFVLRGDALSKGGGDVVQAEAYVAQMRVHGDDVRVLEYHADLDLRADAIVHYFNLDRPYELLDLRRQLQSQPLFISTIHHSDACVRRMRRAQRRGGRVGVLARLPEVVRSLLVFSFRVARDGRARAGARSRAVLHAIAASGALKHRLRSTLESAHGVFVLSELERESLQTDYGWDSSRAILTPNGRPDVNGSSTGRSNRVLVVGRIESRKRQLEAAQTATALGVPLTFVGAPNPNESGYIIEFRREIRESNLHRWVNGVPHEEVLDLMQSSTVLLNCSWVEVQSLVDLEAAFCGCQIVTMRNGGSSHEWLGDCVSELAIDDLDGAVRLAATQSALGEECPRPDYTHTWESTTAIIRRAYSSVQAR